MFYPAKLSFMTKYEFVKRFLPEAEAAEKRFHLNPVVMLAQAAIESGWNESNLAKLHRNLFGITGYAIPSNEFWHLPGGIGPCADCLSASIPIRRVAF